MATLPLFQQNQAPSLACFEAIVDLRPELPEVVGCRKQCKDNYQTQRDTAKDMNDRMGNTPGHRHSQNQQSNRRNLRCDLQLAKIGSIDGEALRRSDTAQASYGKFTSHDNDEDPCCNDLQFKK